MDIPIREASRRRRQRIRSVVISLIVLMVIGGTAGFLLTVDQSKQEGALGIVMGPGAELEVVLTGPPELQLEVHPDLMGGHQWSVSLVYCTVSNRSNRTVQFEDIIYRVKDDEGAVTWEASDGRFTNGGELGPISKGYESYFNIAQNPLTTRQSKVFEIYVKNAVVLK